MVGDIDGLEDGKEVGVREMEGGEVGDNVGCVEVVGGEEGDEVGWRVGCVLGNEVGVAVGELEGLELRLGVEVGLMGTVGLFVSSSRYTNRLFCPSSEEPSTGVVAIDPDKPSIPLLAALLLLSSSPLFDSPSPNPTSTTSTTDTTLAAMTLRLWLVMACLPPTAFLPPRIRTPPKADSSSEELLNDVFLVSIV